MDNNSKPKSFVDSVFSDISASKNKDSSSSPTASDDKTSVSTGFASIFSSKKTDSSDIPDSSTSTSTSTSTSSLGSSTSSVTSFFSKFSWSFWIIVILVLAFLGFNIFVYLAKGSQDISNFFGPIFAKFLALIGYGAKQTLDASAEGTKGAIDVTAATTTDAVNAVQQTVAALPPNGTSAVDNTNANKQTADQNSLNAALNASNKSNQGTEDEGDYQADDSYSSIQGTKSGNKAGWCFIGVDRGIRTCGKVTETDKCMSGDIFPSQEICVNPTLRP